MSQIPAVKKVMDRKVADGDKINIDYVGSVDGVEFENGSSEGLGAEVTIGVTNFIDGFLDQLIGHMPGDMVNVKVRFPDDYFEASLQGKDALFITVINFIVESETLTEITDEYVMDNLYSYYGWQSIEEMKDDMRSDMHEYAIQQYVQKYLSTEVTVKSIPDQLLDYNKKAMLNSYRIYAEEQGATIDELLSNDGYASVDDLYKAEDANIRQNATYYLVLQAIAEDGGFSVTEVDLGNYFFEIDGTPDYSLYEEQFGLPYIKHYVMTQMVLDYIYQSVVLL
jgi:trigger factor